MEHPHSRIGHILRIGPSVRSQLLNQFSNRVFIYRTRSNGLHLQFVDWNISGSCCYCSSHRYSAALVFLEFTLIPRTEYCFVVVINPIAMSLQGNPFIFRHIGRPFVTSQSSTSRIPVTVIEPSGEEAVCPWVLAQQNVHIEQSIEETRS